MNNDSVFDKEYDSGIITKTEDEANKKRAEEEPAPLVIPDVSRYGTGKPRRETIRAKVIHD